MMNDQAISRFLYHRQSPVDEAEVVIVAAPYEGTVSYLPGTASAPAAIIAASAQLEFFEEEVGWEPTVACRLHSLPPVIPLPNESPADYLARLEDSLPPARDGRFLLGIGGEHSITIPLVRHCLGQAAGTVVQIDAHPDLRDSYQGTPFSHACAMRRLLDEGHALLQIGLNCCSREEHEFMAAHADRIHSYWLADLEEDEGEGLLLEELKRLTGAVYLTIDSDGLCPSMMPGTGTPMPAGISWKLLLGILRNLSSNPAVQLKGADIVEVVPLPEMPRSEFSAAKLIQKLLSYRLHHG